MEEDGLGGGAGVWFEGEQAGGGDVLSAEEWPYGGSFDMVREGVPLEGVLVNSW